jgi:hypothetical protein
MLRNLRQFTFVMSAATSVHEILGAAEFMSKDSDLWLCPRFERLHIFNIMALQDRLSELDMELMEGFSKDEPRLTEARPGADIVKDICKSIKAYGSTPIFPCSRELL